jgi:hypothetical protein
MGETSNLDYKVLFFTFIQKVPFRISYAKLNIWIQPLMLISVSPSQLCHDQSRLDPAKHINPLTPNDL